MADAHPKLHAFVAMPFGTKDGVDFDSVYHDLIQPALSGAGFTVARADEEVRAGNIRTDMFQELLLADLVVAELSMDNPNVWYELGVRHALRARGVLHVQGRRDYMPFDVYSDRALRYALKDGKPDAGTLEHDRSALAAMARATVDSWQGRRVSPVYHLLPNLQEPDWRSLRVGEANAFWQRLDEWGRRVEAARSGGRPGYILVLAREVPTRPLRLEALRIAGKALMRLGKPRFALEVFEQALALEPNDLVCRQQKGLALERLGVIGSRPERFQEARQWLEAVVRDHPNDGETLGLLGRTYKDEWVLTWRREGANREQMRQDAAYEDARLREAARVYAAAFRADPLDYYPGINAVTMAWLLRELTGLQDKAFDIESMVHGVQWAVSCRLLRDPKPQWYWARASVAELEVLTGSVASVERAYKEATAVADNDWFALDSSKQQLQMLRDLGIRPAEVAAGIAVLEREQARMTRTQRTAEPALVVLFSGHMVDRPERPEARFPESKAGAAAREIAARLDALGAKEGDLGLAQAACGGDLLFAKACLQRKMRLELRLPQLEPEFLTNSVAFAGPRWQALYDEVKAHPDVRMLFAPEELGPTPLGIEVYERGNLWLLYTALSHGADKARFLCLWNGQGGDGPGGVQHMNDLVQQLTGRKPEVIKPQDLPGNSR